MASTLDQPCLLCDQTTTKRCGRCGSFSYCSKACQEADWPIHKLLCRAYADFDISSRPSENHFLAILFRLSYIRPRLIWLQAPSLRRQLILLKAPLRWIVPFNIGKHRIARTRSLLGEVLGEPQEVSYNSFLQRDLSSFVHIETRDEHTFSSSPPNQCTANLSMITGRGHGDWRGPIIAYALLGRQSFPLDLRDINLTDFRHVVDFLLSRHSSLPRALPAGRTGQVQGVKITCEGDMRLRSIPVYQDWTNDGRNRTSPPGPMSDIGQSIGLPLVSFNDTYSSKWVWPRAWLSGGRSVARSLQEYSEIVVLHLCCDPNRDGLSMGGMRWGKPSPGIHNSGDMILVRQDLKPLELIHIEALVGFAREVVQPLLTRSGAEYRGADRLDKNHALAMITRANFSIYWNSFVERKRAQGNKKTHTSPYDV